MELALQGWARQSPWGRKNYKKKSKNLDEKKKYKITKTDEYETRAVGNLDAECIAEIGYNSTLNVIAVGTRNFQTTRLILGCTELSVMAVRMYEPLPRPFLSGVTRDVDHDLSNEDIEDHMRSLINPVQNYTD